jgi:fatty acid kinase fatty acid binding subunit
MEDGRRQGLTPSRSIAPVSVVTDTTGYLPPSLIEAHGITSISLYYSFADGEPCRESGLEDLGPFYERLRTAASLPTTSPPLVEDFLATYEPLLADGGSVVSVHISSGISETCAVARRAAANLEAAGKGGERIHVLDSASTAGQLGVLALVGARAAAAGRDTQAVVDIMRQARMEIRNRFLLDTLEYLRRGGRIGSAAAWIGSTLNIKPILTLESEIKAVERVRTHERGVERLVDYGRQLHATGAIAWCVQHTCAPDGAQALVERLQEVFWRPPEFVSEIGPVVGTHTGPGLLGVMTTPARFLE